MEKPDKVSFITPKNQKDSWYESIELQEKTISLDDMAFINYGEQFIYDGQVYDFRFSKDDSIKPTSELIEYYKDKWAREETKNGKQNNKSTTTD